MGDLQFFLEIHLSEHEKPEVKAPKMNEIQNLKDYDIFKEF